MIHRSCQVGLRSNLQRQSRFLDIKDLSLIFHPRQRYISPCNLRDSTKWMLLLSTKEWICSDVTSKGKKAKTVLLRSRLSGYKIQTLWMWKMWQICSYKLPELNIILTGIHKHYIQPKKMCSKHLSSECLMSHKGADRTCCFVLCYFSELISFSCCFMYLYQTAMVTMKRLNVTLIVMNGS